MEKKIGIVLLNYKNYNDTIECIKSIENQNYSNYCIIVVDNNSQNESVNKIKTSCKDMNNIYIIENKENLGFAKGNNIGIKFAKENLKSDFVFVLNTDTVLFNENTLKKLISLYKPEEKIAIINPMCCDIEKVIQKPYLIYNSKMWKYVIRMGIYILKQIIKYIFNLDKYKKNNEKFNVEEIKKNKYIIQGCAYILTPDFFKYYSQIFPETFLYCEELALAIYIEKANLKIENSTDVLIIHKEAGSTKEILKDRKKKKIKFQIQSYFKVVKLLFYDYKKIKKLYN